MKITYTLEDFNKGKIIDKYGIQNNGSTHLFFSNSCFKRMQKYVPFKKGTLSTTATVRPTSVTYESDYAIYQYKGYTKGPVKKYNKPGTGPYWDKKMVANEKNQLTKEVENYMKKLKGSR